MESLFSSRHLVKCVYFFMKSNIPFFSCIKFNIFFTNEGIHQTFPRDNYEHVTYSSLNSTQIPSRFKGVHCWTPTFPGAARDIEAPSVAADTPSSASAQLCGCLSLVECGERMEGGWWLVRLSVAGCRLCATHWPGCMLAFGVAFQTCFGRVPSVCSHGGHKTYSYSMYWPTRWK